MIGFYGIIPIKQIAQVVADIIGKEVESYEQETVVGYCSCSYCPI
jgi:hypothetical protein